MAIDSVEEKPRKYPIGRILGLFGWLALFAAVCCILLAFSGYAWIESVEYLEIYLIVGGLGFVLLSGVFIGLAKVLEELARIHARLNSRLTMAQLSGNIGKAVAEKTEAKPKPIRANTSNPVKERVIHISDEEAKRTGVR